MVRKMADYSDIKWYEMVRKMADCSDIKWFEMVRKMADQWHKVVRNGKKDGWLVT